MKPETRVIKIDALARVEGEGGLLLRMEGDRVLDVELRIFEPPRFFEAFLRGRSRTEVPDLTSRICGICPVAYQMSSCHAIEAAAGVRVEGPLRELRRLLYCGEWIESHALHVFMLHMPDFLGYEDALSMAADHPEVLRRGLRIKKAGNAIVALLGGREIHPINVRLGGFHRVPTRRELGVLLPEIEWGLQAALEELAAMARLDFPDFERDYELVSLRQPGEYPFNEGRIVSSRGLDIDVGEFDDHFEEAQVGYSTALHATVRGRGAYFCGPLARYNLNHDLLSQIAQDAAREAGLSVPCLNPFKSLLVRGVELIHAFDEARRLIEGYRPPDRPFVELPARAGVGYGATEAPRGMLVHRYQLAEDGTVVAAKIVPPTSQNQKTIEDDLRAMATVLATLPHEQATRRAEQAIRNFDPCISCSTHFLDLRVERI
jgi:sulfhydrogenase subunit alpha